LGFFGDGVLKGLIFGGLIGDGLISFLCFINGSSSFNRGLVKGEGWWFKFCFGRSWWIIWGTSLFEMFF